MKRLWCYLFGHDSVWVLDPLRDRGAIVICLTCRRRSYGYDRTNGVAS